MAISTMLIGRCYRGPLSRPRRRLGGHHVPEERPQRRQRFQRRERMRHCSRCPADRLVEHPDRNVLGAYDGIDGQTAARQRARRLLDDLVDVHRLPDPRMPRVSYRPTLRDLSIVGVLSLSCTIGSGCTRPWDTEPRPRPAPAWRRLPCARQPDILILPLYSQGGVPSHEPWPKQDQPPDPHTKFLTMPLVDAAIRSGRQQALLQA